MLEKIGHHTLIVATGLLVVTVSLCWAPSQACAQFSAVEVLESTAASHELDSKRNKNKQPAQKKVAQAPSRKRTAVGGTKKFAVRAMEVKFNFVRSIKLLSLVLILWMWVGAADWVGRDAQTHGLGHFKWNAIIFFPFAAVALLLFFLPVPALIRVAVLFVVFLVTWVPYVVVHNKNVEGHRTVLTGSWWRYVFVSLAGKVGVKVSSERKADYEKGAPVELFAMGADNPTTDNANLLSARHSPGYLLVKDLIVDMTTRLAERVLLDFTKQGVSVRYEIDGMWHNGEARDRESGDVMLAVMKTLANLEVKERRKKQDGQFGAKYEGHSYLCPMISQGVASGERVIISLRGDQHHFTSYSQLGMRKGLQSKWEEMMAAEQGIVILSTMPGGGLTTITNVSLEETDRLMRDFVSIEELHHREMEIQNLAIHTYDTSAGETPATILPKLIRTYPNVYVCRDMVDLESAKILIGEVKDERLVITNIKAKEGAEALLRVLQMKVPAKDFAGAAKAVLYQRLIRLLCTECKVGYTPPPEVLKKLGIPAGKIEKLFRPPKQEEIEKPCNACQGLGYKGQTGIFELLEINDAMREILVKQPRVDLLRKAARASHQRLLQEEGVLLVARGVTSIPELMRVLK